MVVLVIHGAAAIFRRRRRAIVCGHRSLRYRATAAKSGHYKPQYQGHDEGLARIPLRLAQINAGFRYTTDINHDYQRNHAQKDNQGVLDQAATYVSNVGLRYLSGMQLARGLCEKSGGTNTA